MQRLQVSNVRALEDVLIELIYNKLLQGKMDQKHSQFVVEFAAGRDMKPGKESLSEMAGIIGQWYRWRRNSMSNHDSGAKKRANFWM